MELITSIHTKLRKKSEHGENLVILVKTSSSPSFHRIFRDFDDDDDDV
jgi:hypothetical protein